MINLSRTGRQLFYVAETINLPPGRTSPQASHHELWDKAALNNIFETVRFGWRRGREPHKFGRLTVEFSGRFLTGTTQLYLTPSDELLISNPATRTVVCLKYG